MPDIATYAPRQSDGFRVAGAVADARLALARCEGTLSAARDCFALGLTAQGIEILAKVESAHRELSAILQVRF